jgi:hypothetical protein
MILDNYDSFNFMVVLVFLYFILVGFIIIIMINAKYHAKNNPALYYNETQNMNPNNTPNTTIGRCTPLNTIANGTC